MGFTVLIAKNIFNDMKQFFIEYMYFGDKYLYREVVKSNDTPINVLNTFKEGKDNIERVTIRRNNFVVAFWKCF